MMRYLSLDGGGIYGIHTAIVLKRILAQAPTFLTSVDVFGGTSIGGIFAMALADGKDPDYIIKFFTDNVKSIFTNTLGRRLRALFGWCAKYPSDGMSTTLAKTFGLKYLSDLRKKCVVQSFQTTGCKHWHMRTFHNFKSIKSNGFDSNEFCLNAGLATSAAPTYFPCKEIGNGNFCIDGGVGQNDPMLTLYAKTMDHRLDVDYRPFTVDDCRLLSIGRIYSDDILTTPPGDWGWKKWLPHAGEMLLTGGSTASKEVCTSLFGRNYQRLESFIPAELNVGMDSVKSLDKLITFSENVDISKTIEWIKNLW